MVKNLPVNAGDIKRCGFHLWVGKSPWRRAWQPPSIFLPGESPGPDMQMTPPLWQKVKRIVFATNGATNIEHPYAKKKKNLYPFLISYKN